MNIIKTLRTFGLKVPEYIPTDAARHISQLVSGIFAAELEQAVIKEIQIADPEFSPEEVFVAMKNHKHGDSEVTLLHVYARTGENFTRKKVMPLDAAVSLIPNERIEAHTQKLPLQDLLTQAISQTK